MGWSKSFLGFAHCSVVCGRSRSFEYIICIDTENFFHWVLGLVILAFVFILIFFRFNCGRKYFPLPSPVLIEVVA